MNPKKLSPFWTWLLSVAMKNDRFWVISDVNNGRHFSQENADSAANMTSRDVEIRTM